MSPKIESKPKSMHDHLSGLIWDGKARLAHWLNSCATRLRPGRDVDTIEERTTALAADDPLVDVLHRALGNRTGKLRVSDAFLICGLEASKVNQDQIARFGRAIRELGWERVRRHRNGALEYAYVKGNATEREVELIVEYDPHTRSVRIEINRGEQPAAN